MYLLLNYVIQPVSILTFEIEKNVPVFFVDILISWQKLYEVKTFKKNISLKDHIIRIWLYKLSIAQK